MTPRGGILALLRGGWLVTARRPGLVAAVWLWHLLIAAALSLPFFAWLHEATATVPAADPLAEGFSFALLDDLLQYNRSSVMHILQTGAVGGAILALVTSPIAAAVTLTALRRGAASRSARDLATAAAQLYWPFLRVIVAGRTLAVLGALAAGAGLGPLLRPLRESSWEAALLWALGLQAACAIAVGVFLLAAVDFALVQLAATADRRSARAWVGALRFAVRRPALVLGLWLSTGLAIALLALLYSVLTSVLPGAGALAVAGAVVLQQAFMVSRTGLRIGLLGAQQEAFLWTHVTDRPVIADATATPALEEPAVERPPEPMLDREQAAASPMGGSVQND